VVPLAPPAAIPAVTGAGGVTNQEAAPRRGVI
jgi:hypothetical protein